MKIGDFFHSTSDKYYDVVRKNENGKVKYEAVESGSYVATAKEITLQPLN